MISRTVLDFFVSDCVPSDTAVQASEMLLTKDFEKIRSCPFFLVDHANTYRTRIQDGHQCLLVLAAGEIVHWAWLARRGLQINEIGEWITIPDGECWIYDVHTAESQRGRGWFPEALRWLQDNLSTQGIGTLGIYCDRNNLGSRRGILKAGFRYRDTVSVLRIGNKFWRRRRLCENITL